MGFLSHCFYVLPFHIEFCCQLRAQASRVTARREAAGAPTPPECPPPPPFPSVPPPPPPPVRSPSPPPVRRRLGSPPKRRAPFPPLPGCSAASTFPPPPSASRSSSSSASPVPMPPPPSPRTESGQVFAVPRSHSEGLRLQGFTTALRCFADGDANDIILRTQQAAISAKRRKVDEQVFLHLFD